MAETSGKRAAQQRVDRIHAFRRELEQLTREGALVLTEEQRASLGTHIERTLQDLADRFDVDVSESQKQISLGMRIVSTLGGLAFCAAVFLFFYRFWGLLSTPVQTAILIATPIICLAAMELLARRERTLYYTSLVGLVVLASFALDLIQVGIIFNITPSPGAFLAWSSLALVLAYTYRLRLALAGGLIGIAIFLTTSLTGLTGNYWGGDPMPENFLAVGLAMIVFPFAVKHRHLPEFPDVYRILGILFVFLSLLLLANAGRMSWLPFGPKPVQGLYQLAGFIAAAAAIWLGLRRRLPWAVNIGSAFFAIYLFNRMFSWWWDWMPKYLFFLILGAIALALLAVFRRIRAGMPGVQPR